MELGLVPVAMMALAIPLVAILLPAIIILGVVKIVTGGSRSRKGREMEAEETRLIQELHHGLSKMAERVESLETILLDKEKKGT